MDFLIKTPFKLSLNIIDLDEHLPSMKMSFNLEASNMQNELKNIGEIWVKTKDYDDFLVSLGKKEFMKSEFSSIDSNFNLVLGEDTSSFFITLRIKKEGLFETSIIQSYINFKLNEDEYFNIIREFEKLKIYI